ncbi:hypothetical protein HK405_004098 [Cladochytrium tenue]|nr:hypothetical protein HK405_004098 [Cladochytrium tenue]
MTFGGFANNRDDPYRHDSGVSTATTAYDRPSPAPSPVPEEQVEEATSSRCAMMMMAETHSAAPPEPAARPRRQTTTSSRRVRVTAESLRLLEVADSASDSAFSDANTLKARTAVRYALRNSERLDAIAADRVLGYGSNGVVLSGRVVDPSSPAAGTSVAVKIIYKGTHAPARAPVPSEVSILQSLSDQGVHTGVLNSLDYWQDERHHYMVTELFGNDWLATMFPADAPPAPDDVLSFYNPCLRSTHTLIVSPGSSDLWAWGIAVKHHNTQRYVQQHPGADDDEVAAGASLADPRHVRSIFRQAVDATHRLHTQAGVVHGDIKEENVLVQSVAVECCDPSHRPGGAPHRHHELHVRLADFGHAQRRTTLTSYGTPHVTAPELQKARPGPRAPADGVRADVFALGVLLFTLAHGPGRVPAVLESSRLLPTHGLLPMDADLDSRVEPGCVELIRGMTMCNPAERWTLDRVLEHPWLRG